MLGDQLSRANHEAAKPGQPRVAGLDGMRGLAAVGVMLHHIFFFYAPWQFGSIPVAPLADWLRAYGWTLVDLFFLLSGYVFAEVYRRDDRLQTAEGLKDFAVARFARLWPLHLTVLVLISLFGVSNQANSLAAFGAHLLMLQGFVSPVAGTYDWSSWSLSIEVLCYLVFAAAYSNGKRTLYLVSALMIGASLLGYMVHLHSGGPYAGSIVRRGLLGFFMGQMIWTYRDQLARIPVPVLAVPFLLGLYLESGNYSPVIPLSLLAWPAILLAALRLEVFQSRLLLWLGERSYGIYLINLPIVQEAVFRIPPQGLGPLQLLGVQVGIAATVMALATFAYAMIEYPARHAIRDYWQRLKAARGSLVKLPA